jgi:HYR domain-containing protein/FIMAH domain-containing protein
MEGLMGRFSRAHFVWFLRVPSVAVLAAVLMASSLASASAAAQPRPGLDNNGSQGAQGTWLAPGKHVPNLASLSNAKGFDRVVVPNRLQGRAPNAQAEPGPAIPHVGAAPAIRTVERASGALGSSGAATPNAPVGATFIGVRQGESGQIPPDPTMAAGPLQIVVMTNGRIKAFTKTGTLVPNSSMSLGQFFSSLSGAADGPFDPKAAFDPYINRFWLMSVSQHEATAADNTNRSTFLIAISDTNDVTQGWTFFQMDASINGNQASGRWCDYPQLGFDSQAVYFTCNMFQFGNPLINIAYSKVRILLKSEFTGGGCCTWWDEWNFHEGFLNLIPSFTMQPAKMYGARDFDGEFLVDSHTTCIGSCSDLEVFRITNAQNCCNGSAGPTFNQTGHGVGNFPSPTGGRQSGSTTRLDTGDTRLLYAFWQNGRLFTGQNMSDSGNSSVSFFELDVAAGLGGINTVQAWQLTNAGVDYYYPEVDVNAAGDKAMVFSRSSSSEFVSARFVTIPRTSTCVACIGPEIVLANGDSTYVQIDPNGNRNRWGDYSGAAADPDGTGIWVHGEFASASNSWTTVVGLAYETIETDLGMTGVPANITVNATSPSGAVVTYAMPTAVDEPGDNPPPTVSCTPAPGSTFPIGTTTVTCTATSADDTPSTVSRTFTVTVLDTDLGLAGVPANITVNATSTSGAVVTYAMPTAVDEADLVAPTVSCSPASGSTFPIGTTTVTCTATSADDNPSSVSQSFTVTVNDTDLGIAGVPANMTVDVNSPLGAVVTWPMPMAIDEAGDVPAPSVSCTPASGSTFSLGTTTVTCTAASADDNPSTVSKSFTVTVAATPAGISNVVDQLLAAGCIDNAGIANALKAKLAAAQNAIAAGNLNEAINILRAFIRQVQAQDGKHILAACTINGVTFSPAAILIADAQSLIDSLTAAAAANPLGHLQGILRRVI